ncbi:UNVERIFIED_CONTAM: SDR family NAD(P)-dependent oxidoreductase [Limosilactobacillus fermentum]|uniref:SDR family NAD(P)-dependent oxidoreductase n=1 Tax=Limosilactobacillus fermentum TaxID=1613 RepID=UPI002D768AC6|nr:SDR family NAD(P)-dependent oxidoreductase [Limosilactobacillus fermentum]MED7635824.1 SDR family NAD(P)-dependent oxidoreductase [Limosilactobacillus fermentum]WRQ25448.1 SDR family NAD(P)-dependent oxidoreductase [Limosilactobacillus fermentum]
MKTWLITGISSGFGNSLTKLLLEKGDTVIGTVRSDNPKVAALQRDYPDQLDVVHLDVTDTAAIRRVVAEAVAKHGRIIETVDQKPAPLHLVLDSRARQATIERLTERLKEYQGQAGVAKSTDIED